jgi:ATP-dependent Lon protease
MKESAQAAFSFIKSNNQKFKINPELFETKDFHVHVPDGATPKDGPSAGVTIVAALVSLMTDKPVRSGVAMTGEITLRGKVTPVGGIKEKVIAALRAGIKTIILPDGNSKDLEDIPPEIRKKIDFKFYDSADKAVKFLLLDKKKVR